jgi:hypothetical protein
MKLMIVIDEADGCETDAVTVTLLTGAAANARQISAVPRWTFVRTTSCQVRPAPVTLETVVVPELLSVAMKASRSSLPDVVEALRRHRRRGSTAADR